MFVRIVSCRRRLEVLNPPFRDIVEHSFTGSYLLKPYGAHYRKALRILNKKVESVQSDWTGFTVWGSPIVPLAPPA
jgi:hypothetical protein